MHDPEEGVTPEGLIVTGARRDRVPPVFEPVLSAVAQRVPDTVSLYLYGSVATGMARPRSSDVDLVAIGLPSDRAAALGSELSSEYAALCRGVEIAPAVTDDYVGDGDAAYGNRVFLRHYCVHLQGPDPAVDLPAYAADAGAARGFNGDLVRHLETWRSRDPSAKLGRRVARKTLLAVAGLVSVHDTTWTTDRELAARRWAELEPGLATGLDALLAWSDASATARSTELTAALADGGVVGRITAAFAARIGLWPV